ncbi:adenosine receptor A3-like [Anneissia japonica]|uniref:adenosine receptor A3-like n=1 Tax=Anneissia japonica TaxID=1529436 RepID=UPI0014259237|nr:adenosine receptor A3-like [Anneissia japonica]
MNESYYDDIYDDIFFIINHSPVSEFCMIMTLVIGVITIIENAVTVLMLCCVQQLRKRQHVLIGNLAVVDFLVGIVTIQILISNFRIPYILHYFSSLKVTSSAMFSLIWIFAVSLERFLAIVVAPVRYRYICNKCRLITACLLLWIISIIFIFFILVMMTIGIFDQNYLKVVYLIYFSMTCIIGIIYVIIFISVKLQSNRLETGCVSGAARQARLKSLFFTFAILFGLLCLCLLPNQIFMMFIINNKSTNDGFSFHNTLLAVFYDISHVLLPLNSALNPFVYWWRIPEFRQGYTRILMPCKSKCCSARGAEHSDSAVVSTTTTL